MPKSKYKPKVVLVTDPVEVASIRRNGYGDIVGVIDSKGDAYADPGNLRVWRAQQTPTDIATRRLSKSNE